MRLAIYARVSTDDQKADLQLDALRDYAKARKLNITKEYVDTISGAKNTRPALSSLLADARRRKFDAVAVWKIDRLGRSVVHLLEVLNELQVLGIDFISQQEAMDTSTPAGKMVFTFLGAVSEFERSIIRERVRAGMAAAKKRGKHCGRPAKRIDRERAQTLRASGHSLRNIAKAMKVSHQTVANALVA
jgi:DNA invertase Pin-like site-specific DNA recombinase